MSITCTQRIADIEMKDVIQWANNTGLGVVYNQLVFIPGDTGFGMVGIANTAIAIGATGPVTIEGVVQLPAAAVAINAGQTVQAASGGTACTAAGTTSGLYALGVCKDTIATSAGFVNVNLNFGPQAFKVW
jgi:predicted RecA/RadA family phage recombinase